MPLDWKDWNKGEKVETLEHMVERFLIKNKKHAFTSSEIAQSIYNLRLDDVNSLLEGVISFSAVDNALRHLVREGTVQSRVIKKDDLKTEYFTII